jgi:Uma2 family endonuclease
MLYPTDQTPLRVFHDDMGVNAPIIHQRVIARLTAFLYPLFQQGVIQYEPLPKTMLGEYSSPTPDLILYHNETDQTRVVVEVCQTRGVKGDLQKVIQLIDGELYGIEEGFVYDYKTGHWLRYRKGDGGLSQPSAQSDILGLDLSLYV